MEQVIGIVAKVNDRGVLLSGRSEWANVSKWASGVALPRVGEKVTLRLDAAGFIRRIEPTADAAPDAPEQATVRAAASDTLQARIAALQAAVGIVARESGSMSVERVLAAANQLAAWLVKE